MNRICRTEANGVSALANPADVRPWAIAMRSTPLRLAEEGQRRLYREGLTLPMITLILEVS